MNFKYMINSAFIGLALLLANITHAENATYYVNDILGSPVQAYNSNKDLLWTEEYKPYGGKIQSPDGNKNDVGYTGHQSDDDSGLTYMQARYYDAEIGRFYSIDPVDFKIDNLQTFNRYSYGNNNPYKYTDPFGKETMNLFLFTESSMLAKMFGFNSSADGNEAVSKLGDNVANAIDKMASKENLAAISETSGALAIGATFAGQPEIAIPAGIISTTTGVASALRSENPVKGVAIEVGTTLIQVKSVGTIAKVLNGAVGDKMPTVTKNIVNGTAGVVEKAVGDKIKENF